MALCPVCFCENPTRVCEKCGFDSSLDLEKYPSLTLVPKGTPSKFQQRLAYFDRLQKSVLLPDKEPPEAHDLYKVALITNESDAAYTEDEEDFVDGYDTDEDADFVDGYDTDEDADFVDGYDEDYIDDWEEEDYAQGNEPLNRTYLLFVILLALMLLFCLLLIAAREDSFFRTANTAGSTGITTISMQQMPSGK